MNANERCKELVSNLYKDVLLRDAALNNGVKAHLKPGSRILDAGCGLDAPISAIHAASTELSVGVDLVKTFTPPPNVEIVRADLNSLPFKDGYFDLIFSRSVCEHLKEPRLVFSEVSRILKDGGVVVVVTPNKFDYASIFASLIPNRFHGKFIKATAAGDEEVYDDFPTYFKCNSKMSIKKAVKGTGLKLQKIAYIRHYPYYLMFSVPLFYLGVAYDRLITWTGLKFLQPSIYFELKKSST